MRNEEYGLVCKSCKKMLLKKKPTKRKASERKKQPGVHFSCTSTSRSTATKFQVYLMIYDGDIVNMMDTANKCLFTAVLHSFLILYDGWWIFILHYNIWLVQNYLKPLLCSMKLPKFDFLFMMKV